MEDRERQIEAVKKAITALKVDLGPAFDHADNRLCAKMKSVISIRQARDYLLELDAQHWITIEEKTPEEGGWILS